MYLVAIAWMYVVLMMAVVEAFSPQGSVLGAVFTLLLYGLLPLSIVLYLMGTPQRWAARRRQEAAEREAHRREGSHETDERHPDRPAPGGEAPSAVPADHRGHPPAAPAVDALVPERKEP